MAELLHHQFGGVGIQRLGDGRHHAELHQRLDHVAGARGHAVGQFLDGDRVRQDDVAHHFHLIGAQPLQFGLAALAFALAAHRGERADALVLALDRGLHVDAAGAAAVVGALLGDDGLRLARQHARRRGGGSAAPRRPPRAPACRGAAAASRSARPASRRRGGAAGRRRASSAPRAAGAAAWAAAVGLGRLARRLLGLLPAPPPRPRAGPPLPRPCAPLPRAGAPPRRPTGSRSSPARAAPPRAGALRAAARPARAGARPARSRSARAAARRCGRPLPGAGAAARRWRRAGPASAGAAGRCAGRADRGALLAHLDLHDLGAAWLKLCRTEPASTVRPSSRRPAGRRESRPLLVS